MTRRLRPPVTLGVDPGGHTTGLAVRHADALLGHVLVDAHPAEREGWGVLGGLPSPYYLDRIVAAIDALRLAHAVDLVAVEAVTPPVGFARGKRHTIDPGALIGVAGVAGAVCARYAPHGLVVVPPASNGSHPLAYYPPPLVGDRERAGTGRLRHARSAWDVAGRGSVIALQEARSA